MALETTGAAMPGRLAKVFTNPKTVPLYCGAMSATIGRSPPVWKPYINMDMMSKTATAVGSQPTLGIRARHSASPNRAVKIKH